MPTSFTTNLRLSNPGLGDTGWGTTVSDGMISLVDPAIAGTTTLSTDADVTLTTANGATDQARQMILNCTGSRAAQRTITAPASSKVYVVINGTTGGFGVKIVGVGPTTGVVVPAGRMAVLAWNGSDFVTLGAVVDLTASGNVSVAGTTTLAALNASGNVSFDGGTFVFNESGADKDARFEGDTDANLLFLDASTDRVGIGTNAPAAKLHITNTGTTSGSLSLASPPAGSGGSYIIMGNADSGGAAGPSVILASNRTLQFGVGTSFTSNTGGTFSEQMRLDSSGNVGIGTNAPGAKLDVAGNIRVGSGNSFYWGDATSQITATNGGPMLFLTGTGAERMRLDASGNLGIGTSSPGSKLVVSNAAAATRITITDDVANGRSGYIESNFSDALVIGTTSGVRGIRFSPDNTPRMFLDTSGNLGIGTSSPGANLQVGGSTSGSQVIALAYSAVSAGTIDFRANGSVFGAGWIQHDAASGAMRFGTAGSERMRLNASGNLGLGVSNPAYLIDATASGSGDTTFRLTKTGSINATINAVTGALTFGIDGSGGATERARITSTGNVVAGGSVALATTATDGFLYVPTCAGTPTGTPTAITGMAPIVVNTTNNKLYFYSGGQWRDAGP